MRPGTTERSTLDGPVAGSRVCHPDLLADGPARQVAQLLAADDHIGIDGASGLVAAVEAYDLATARVLWCQECPPDAVHAQDAALLWHQQEQHQAYVDMLATLRQSTGSDRFPGVEQAS